MERTPDETARPPADALLHDQRRARRPRTDQRLSRSRTDRLLGGVCGGIARFVGVSSTGVRLVYAFTIVVSLGATAALYLLLWLIIPNAAAREAVTGGA